MKLVGKNPIICGIDEAGRGAFAGPLVVASVFIENQAIVEQNLALLPIRDSKTLSEPQRERVFNAICELQIPFQTTIIPVITINKKGIGWANTHGIKQLIKHSSPLLECQSVDTLRVEVIIDGYFPLKKIAVKGVNVRCQVDADATVFAVILAGIVAKVTRDRIMKKLHEEFEYYEWRKNKGYGTKHHIEAIRSKGMCPHHRTQFVQTALQKIY